MVWYKATKFLVYLHSLEVEITVSYWSDLAEQTQIYYTFPMWKPMIFYSHAILILISNSGTAYDNSLEITSQGRPCVCV